MPPARVLLWTMTVGAIALAVKSYFVDPPPLWFVLAAFQGYLAVTVTGYFFPELGMYGDVIARGPKSKGRLSLTFDDGPEPTSTPQILRMLGERGHRGTFFVIGRKAEAHPELIRDIVAQGHELGLHGYQHSRVTAFRTAGWMRADLTRAKAVLLAITGKTPSWFRPPINHLTPRLAAVADELELTLVGCSVRGLDGTARADADRVAARVMRRLRPGAIVALHDASERGTHVPASLLALPTILQELDQRGEHSVTLSELLGEGGRKLGGEGKVADETRPAGEGFIEPDATPRALDESPTHG
jgi:peptidoglycan-N-acetylglucosamine deacetylase